MALDFIENEDSWSNASPEAASEQSEKQREKSSRAIAGIARSQKDESKGKKAANILSHFLAEFLKHPDYDVFIEPVFEALKCNIPSAYLVGILALVSHKASDTLRMEYGGRDMELIKTEPIPESSKVLYQSKNLRQDIRLRINEWVEDLFLAATKNPSSILTGKFLQLLGKKQERDVFLECLTTAISFFFLKKNIVISIEESRAFSLFILVELEKRVKAIQLEEV